MHTSGLQGVPADPQPNNALAGNLLTHSEMAEISQVPFLLLVKLTAFCNAVSTFL